MPEFQRAAGVLMHEDALNNDDVRLELADDIVNRIEYLSKSIGKCAVRTLDRAAGHIGWRVALKIEHTEAGQA